MAAVLAKEESWDMLKDALTLCFGLGGGTTAERNAEVRRGRHHEPLSTPACLACSQQLIYLSIDHHGRSMPRAFADVPGSADSSGSIDNSHAPLDNTAGPSNVSHVSLFSSPTSRSLPLRPSVSATMRANSQHALEISSAQKDVDDPNTPVESQRDTEATSSDDRSLTVSAVPHLSSGEMFMPTSRIPSYVNASGPLYVRGRSLLGRA